MQKNTILQLVVFLLFTHIAVSQVTTTIPFTYHGHLYFNVTVNNKHKGSFVFDTGAPDFYLDTFFCETDAIKFTNTVTSKLGGVGNEQSHIEIVKDALTYTVHNSLVNTNSNIFTIVLDVKNILGKQIDGILGLSTFSKQMYVIDYMASAIQFTNNVSGYEYINARFEANRIFVPMEVTLQNGRTIKGEFVVDTGSPSTVLNSSFYKEDGIYNNKKKTKYYSRGGVGGKTEGYDFFVKKLTIGSKVLDDMDMSVSVDSLGALASNNYAGIIGNDVLDDFYVAIDHTKKLFLLKPNSNFNNNYKQLYKGIAFLDRTDIGKHWMVSFIYEETNAYQNGLRVYDIVLKVNGTKVEDLDYFEFYKQLKPGSKLTFTISRNGVVKNITCKLNVFLKV